MISQVVNIPILYPNYCGRNSFINTLDWL